MSDQVHVFVYDPKHTRGIETERVRDDVVNGTLFDVEGVGPALMLAGQNRVPGTVRRVRAEKLDAIDQAVGIATGLYRRVGIRIGNAPCWTWVAGPKLAQRLAIARVRATEPT